MKKLTLSSVVSRNKKIACTISAAALMLGVSSAATVGLHFQENYCGAPAYSGYLVTLTAFGIESNGWENLLPMDTGYSSCKGPLGYDLGPELIDTTTTTNGLNPLPNGALTVSWFGPTANFDPFAGYAGTPPTYSGPGGTTQANDDATNPVSGEQQIYATFIRDGVNFGPGSSGGDNSQPGYLVNITGLKSLFTNSPFVVELMASADSTEVFTNAFVVDVTDSLTNSVTYPRTPLPDDSEGTSYYQGTGGGLSTGSAALNTDHIQIMSAPPQHVAGEFNHCGTISGFILTDKPVVSMYPQTIPVAGPGDTITLNPYVIGVPPLSFQWRLNGAPVPGATNMSYVIPSVNLGSGGNYDLVASNAYGMATSKVSTVTVDTIVQIPASNLVYDSNPVNPQNDGVDFGATWLLATNTVTSAQVGALSFDAAESNGVTVADSPAFNGSTGTVSFWMQSSGTDITSPGGDGASLLSRISGPNGNDFILVQNDGSPGTLFFEAPNTSGGTSANTFTSVKGVSDGKSHFVTLTFDQSASGGVAVYIDGALDTTNANAAAWTWAAGQPLEIGYTTDPTFREYNGLFSDVRYYSKILTASQITTIYTSGALVDTTDLQLEFEFATPPENGYILSWLEGSAVLQSAPSLSGPWSTLQGVTSPYLIVPADSQQFFRYQYVPQTIESNPFLM
jgi:hypothetical protein